eukprot:446045_1
MGRYLWNQMACPRVDTDGNLFGYVGFSGDMDGSDVTFASTTPRCAPPEKVTEDVVVVVDAFGGVLDSVLLVMASVCFADINNHHKRHYPLDDVL